MGGMCIINKTISENKIHWPDRNCIAILSTLMKIQKRGRNTGGLCRLIIDNVYFEQTLAIDGKRVTSEERSHFYANSFDLK